MKKRTAARRHSFFSRNIAILMAMSILPAMAMGILLDTLYSHLLTDVLTRDAQLATDQITSGFMSLLGEYETVADALCSETSIQQMLAGDHSQDMAAIGALNRQMFRQVRRIEIHLIPYSNRSGISSGFRPNLYRYSVYKSLYIFAELSRLPTQTVVFPMRYRSSTGSTVSLALARQVWHEGQAAGCVIVDIYRGVIDDIAQSVNGNSNRHFSLVFDDGTIIVDSRSNQREGLRLAQAYTGELTEQPINTNEQKREISNHAAFGSPESAYGFTVINTIDTSVIERSRQRMHTILFLLLVATALLCMWVSFRMSRRVSAPLMLVCDALGDIENGKMETRVDLKQNISEFTALEHGINHLVELLNRYISDKVEEGQLVKQAELKALQAQVNPHFINNTLSAIRSLARLNNEPEILKISFNLSQLLHANLDNSAATITIREDIALINCYLSIQNTRFNNKFELNVTIPEALQNCLIPRMILQTITENAIKHGLEAKVGTGHIDISATEQEGFLLITVTDDGIGMPSDRLEWIRGRLSLDKPNGEHIGLLNANRRLQLHYGKPCGLSVESYPGRGTTIKVLIRAERDAG